MKSFSFVRFMAVFLLVAVLVGIVFYTFRMFETGWFQNASFALTFLFVFFILILTYLVIKGLSKVLSGKSPF